MKHTVKPGKRVRLGDHDPAATPGCRNEAEAERRLARLRERMRELQGLLFADDRFALLVVLQGIDGSGKDGTISRVMSGVSPLGCHVTAFGVPSAEELDHDFLWRIHAACPRRGEVAIFNRSHYEDVLVARVKGLVPKAVWKRRYKQINQFEKGLAGNGTVLLKFFLHISRAEQKLRFEERLRNPRKYWKFRMGDIEDRALWDDYMEAYEDALERCSTEEAPWTIVPSDRKWYRDLVVAETIVETLEGLGMRWPAPGFDPGKVVIPD